MARYVLVHGAWEGSWYWRLVAERLRAAGHQVFTPSLTGLGERTHLLTREVDLDTHIEDVCAVLHYEELSEIVLCGHSYGGMVITGAAERMAERIASIVYLDAFLPEDGQCLLDLALPERRAQLLDLAETRGDGWRVPPITAAAWGVADPAERAWIDRLCGDHPLASLRQPLRHSGRHLGIARKTYVLATAYDPSPFQAFAAHTGKDPAWRQRTIDCHHMISISAPDAVTEILLEAA
jgi:pimeloyl-ACP methyl ester carboxylesterase